MGTMYSIHNTVRSRTNRTLRAAAPAHSRFKQHVGVEQTRLVRGRPILMNEEQLQKNLEELKQKQKAGILEVRLPDGRVLDLETMQPTTPLVTQPTPHPPLDSAARDLPAGQTMPQFPGGQTEVDLSPIDVTDLPAELQPQPEVHPEPPGHTEGDVDFSESHARKSGKGKAKR